MLKSSDILDAIGNTSLVQLANLTSKEMSNVYVKLEFEKAVRRIGQYRRLGDGSAIGATQVQCYGIAR